MRSVIYHQYGRFLQFIKYVVGAAIGLALRWTKIILTELVANVPVATAEGPPL